MFCMQCGTKLPDTALFCYACGQKTAIPQQEATNQPQAPLPNAVMGNVELVEYIKEIQRAILNRIIEALESDDSQLSDTAMEQKVDIAHDVLALLNYEQDPDNSVPICSSQADVIARLGTLVKKYPFLQPVYNQFATGQTQSAHAVSMGQVASSVQETPAARVIYALGNLDATARKAGVRDENFQEAFQLMNEVRSVANNPEVNKLSPILTIYENAWYIGKYLYKRWEKAAQAKNIKLLASDYQKYAEVGCVKVGVDAGIDAGRFHNLVVPLSDYVGIVVWMDFSILGDLLYFLFMTGQEYPLVHKYRDTFEKRFGVEWFDYVRGEAKMRAASDITDAAMKEFKRKQGR